MKKIPLTQGKFALVDDEDYEKLSRHNWCAVKIGRGFYAARGERRGGGRGLGIGKTFAVLMHRQITKFPHNLVVDHVNHNGLDNRKLNLRVCTRAQNNQNLAGARRNSKTGIRGVSWNKRDNLYHAELSHDGKRVRKTFKTVSAARKFYKETNKKEFGNFGGKL